jgi:hypothetical protein
MLAHQTIPNDIVFYARSHIGSDVPLDMAIEGTRVKRNKCHGIVSTESHSLTLNLHENPHFARFQGEVDTPVVEY